MIIEVSLVWLLFLSGLLSPAANISITFLLLPIFSAYKKRLIDLFYDDRFDTPWS